MSFLKFLQENFCTDDVERIVLEQVMKKADSQHPEYHRSQKFEQEILEEAAVTKKGVTVKVRKKS